MPAASIAVLLAALALAKDGKNDAVLSQDITIRGRGPSGPEVSMPAPAMDAQAIDEVIRSLELYKGAAPMSKPPRAAGPAKRVAKPFPPPPYLVLDASAVTQPCNRWTFEVLSGEVVLWRTEGTGQPKGRIEWDGTDVTGAPVLKIGTSYYFRFTGFKGADENTLTSEPVQLDSVSFRETLGNGRMEVANAVLFDKGRSTLAVAAPEYLNRMAARMAGAAVRFTLYQAKPESALAKARAQAIRSYLSTYLVVHPSKIAVDVRSIGTRGDVTSCETAPEKGEAIRAR